MATLYGENASKRLELEPSEKVKVKEEHGRRRVSYDMATVPNGSNIADECILAKIPLGAKVYDVRVVTTASGSAGNIKLGWTASADGTEAKDDDGFLDGTVALDDDTGSMWQSPALAGFLKEFDAEVSVLATIDGAAATADAVVHVMVEYVID
jgi:hypothetical protein